MHADPKQHCPLRWRTHWFSGTWPLEGSAEQERGSLGMSALGHQNYLPQEEFSESLTCSHKHVRDAGRKSEAAGVQRWWSPTPRNNKQPFSIARVVKVLLRRSYQGTSCPIWVHPPPAASPKCSRTPLTKLREDGRHYPRATLPPIQCRCWVLKQLLDTFEWIAACWYLYFVKHFGQPWSIQPPIHPPTHPSCCGKMKSSTIELNNWSLVFQHLFESLKGPNLTEPR